MACCIAIALVIAVVRRALGLGQAPARAGSFAPTADRRGPLSTLPSGPATDPSERPATTGVARRRTSTVAMRASVATGIGAGLLIHLGLVAALVAAGAADASLGTAGATLRLVGVAGLAAAGLITGLRPAVRLVPASVVVAAGFTLGLAGLVDMHVLGTFTIAGGALTADLLFHAAGPTLATIGGLLLSRSPSHAPALERS